MAKAYYLSEEDAEVLRDLIKHHGNKIRQGEAQLSPSLFEFSEEDPNDTFTPEVYIVGIPTDGIPGMDYNGGTGAAVPGHAECTIHKMVYNDDEDEWRVEETNFTKEVYNLASAPITRASKSPFSLAIRDKYGKWIGGFGGPQMILGVLDGIMSYQGSATVSIWDGTSDTGQDITAYDWLLSSGQSLANGKKVVVLPHANGKYYVVGAQCT
jgi:hypothetical protein